MNKSLFLILCGLSVFVLAAGASYAVFSKRTDLLSLPAVSKPVEKTASGNPVFDKTLPLTQVCPLNGVKYSTQQEQWWQQHEPMGVMVENHKDARPQSGLSFADVVYEAVAEGGIPRFLSLFYCQDAPQVGPIRSARVYFLDFLSAYGSYPLYVHVGGANADGPADALQELDEWGWAGYNDINQFSVGFPTFWRDYERLPDVATEHTMYSSTQKLWDFAQKDRNITDMAHGKPWNQDFTPYSFVDDASVAKRAKNQTIDLTFWSGTPDYDVSWHYDPKTNIYLRFNGGQPHTDVDTKQQLSAKNIIVLFMEESHANDGYENGAHLLYRTTGSGDAIVFMNGKRTDAIWKKASRTTQLTLTTTDGSPIPFVRGKLWFEILPTTGDVTVR